MKIVVRVKLRAREARVEHTGEKEYVVHLHQAPIEGRANEELREILSDHFGIAKTRITIRSGLRSKTKCVELS